MKTVVMVHGWEGYPDEGWRPWLQGELWRRGFRVAIPAMPDAAHPVMQRWVDTLAATIGEPDDETYLVGHSLGCIAILRYLETLGDRHHIGGAILVAGFVSDLTYAWYGRELSGFFETPIPWEQIRTRCSNFVAIHSDNDPWVDGDNLQVFKDEAGAVGVLEHDMGHFSGGDGITELPIVLDELLRIASSGHSPGFQI